MHAELAVEGTRVGRKRIARLTRAAGLEGISRGKRGRTTRRDRAYADRYQASALKMFEKSSVQTRPASA